MSDCKKCEGSGEGYKMPEGHPETPRVCSQCNGTGKERRIRLERRKGQACLLPKCEYPIAPFPDKRVGHFYYIYLQATIRVEHTFADCRTLKQRRK